MEDKLRAVQSISPSTATTNIQHPDYFRYYTCILPERMLIQNNLVKLRRKGYHDYAVDTGNSHMGFYDVTSWSYVNLHHPIRQLVFPVCYSVVAEFHAKLVKHSRS